MYVKELLKNPKLIESCRVTQSLAKKLDVFEKFVAFAESLKIVDERLEKNSLNGYFLVEVVLAVRTVKSTLFTHEENKEAERRYIEAEKEAAEVGGTVVALVSTTAVGGIKSAYPNYFADSTEFVKHLLMVTRAPIERNNRKKELIDFISQNIR